MCNNLILQHCIRPPASVTAELCYQTDIEQIHVVSLHCDDFTTATQHNTGCSEDKMHSGERSSGNGEHIKETEMSGLV